MRDFPTIIKIIELKSKSIFGSTNKMLQVAGLSKSVLDNMKREKPSIPSIDKFCKIAEVLSISIDYLVGLTDNENTGHADITPAIAHNKKENELLKMFRELDYEAQGDIFDIVKLKYEKSIKKATEKSSASVGTNEGVNIT